MNKLKEMLAKNLNLSMEDNAQVEVNFNIDTDEDGAPTDDDVDVPVVTPDEMADDEQNKDEIESEGETDSAEADMDQLQEAQDSLESLGSVLIKHDNDRTLSRMGVGFYKLALESIVGSEMLAQIQVPSFESRDYSKHHAMVLSLESHFEITKHLNTVSMESNFNWLKKLRHQVAVFFKGEEALLKRAKGLRAISQTSKGEHASNDAITVNESKGLKLPILLTRKWSSEDEFVKNVTEFTNLYNSMAEVGTKFSDEFVDNIFPNSNEWKATDKGGKVYEMFGMKLIRKELIEGFDAEKVIQKTTVVNLSPATCDKVLDLVIVTLSKGDMVRSNITTMCNACERVKQVNVSTSDTVSHIGKDSDTTATTTSTSVSYPDGYLEMMKTLEDLMVLKNKTITEILNYVNYSLTDREFN